MSDLFFTANKTTTDASKAESITSIDLQTYAGQSDTVSFRIGNRGESESILLYSSDPNLSFSFHDSRGYAPALDYVAPSGRVGETVFLKVTAPLDAIEGMRISSINTTDAELSLGVNYFLASTDQGDTEVSKIERFTGSETINILEQFENEGEAVVLTRYDPLPKPNLCDSPTEPMSPRAWESRYDVAEWCNPGNPSVGYELVDTYATKAFIGDQSLDQNTIHDFIAGELNYQDENRILLPPDFEGFNPKPIHKKVPFGRGVTFQTQAYQRTVWTVERDNGTYGLLNIRQSKYFRGQFLCFVADLARVNFPGVESSVGWLPWNILFDTHGKQIHYVKSWSNVVDDPYDPYFGGSE